jgi:hypothetical protein
VEQDKEEKLIIRSDGRTEEEEGLRGQAACRLLTSIIQSLTTLLLLVILCLAAVLSGPLAALRLRSPSGLSLLILLPLCRHSLMRALGSGLVPPAF